MASSLSSLADNLAEGIHTIKCKDCNCFLGYESVKGNSIKYKCLSYNKYYSNKIDEELENRFKNIFKFSNNDINKFILLFILLSTWMIRKRSLPEKEELYSNLNLEILHMQITCIQKKFVKILKQKI